MKSRDAYTESFAERGSKYDQAMRQVPGSRQPEFMAVVDELPENRPGLVLDVPAGGGYLKQYLPSGFRYTSYEPVGSFSDGSQADAERSLLPFPQDACSVDFVLSVAGVHHFPDKTPVFDEMLRVIRPEGQLILADVHAQSKVASFLDGYIDASNSTGHKGYYLGENTIRELESCGWRIDSARRKHYHWLFESEQQMSEYCHLLFDIRHPDTAKTRLQIREDLGVEQLPDGSIGMSWELFVISATKR